MEGHKDFIREENEKQRKWEEELLKADQEQYIYHIIINVKNA